MRLVKLRPFSLRRRTGWGDHKTAKRCQRTFSSNISRNCALTPLVTYNSNHIYSRPGFMGRVDRVKEEKALILVTFTV